MFLFYKLNKAIYGYLSKDERDRIASAFLFGADGHETQLRSSGDPYFTHPVAVSCVLAGMRLDAETIIAALLHDIIEDTAFTKADIAAGYGDKVAQLVEGVTKLTKIEFTTKAEQQAENFRKMILAMVKDIRVILIKLADRLHNMTTLKPLRPDKRRRIAQETLEIYAPIAHRLGMHHFKNSFEELAFEGAYPYRYLILKAKVKRAEQHRGRLFDKILEKLRHHLGKLVIDSDQIIGRKKRLYSIYRKMRDRDMSFSEIMDIYAYRVIAPTRRDCYMILGAVHEIFRPIPGKFKDYISTPKANGYQSLHTTVFGPYGVPVEIQIKTKIMEDTAERGIAAHWIYKSKSLSHDNAQKWLKKLSDLQRYVTTPIDFIKSVKLDLFPDEVYVFTPDGEIIELPKKATCIDFAYHIHTDIGNHCVATKVNRRIAPLSYILRHGDTVEVITAPEAHPNPSWLNFVTTARAKHSIKHALKRQQQETLVQMGKHILEQALSRKYLQISEIDPDIVEQALNAFNFSSLDALYKSIGDASFSANSLLTFLEKLDVKNNQTAALDDSGVINIDNQGLSYLSSCCTPIPNDSIVGVLVPEKGLQVHRRRCFHLKRLLLQRHAKIEVTWSDSLNLSYSARLMILLENVQGAIAMITANMARKNAHIIRFNICESDEKYGIIETVVAVKNRKHLADIVRALKHVKIFLKIERPLA